MAVLRKNGVVVDAEIKDDPCDWSAVIVDLMYWLNRRKVRRSYRMKKGADVLKKLNPGVVVDIR